MASTTTSSYYGAITAPVGQVGHYEPFNAPDTLYVKNIITQCICVGLTGVLFFMRVYVRSCIKKTWIIEDWFTVLSYLSLVGYSMLLTTLIHHHGGTHEWNVSPTDMEGVLYIWYGPASIFVKITILMLFLRVFSPNKKSRLTYTIYGFMAVIICFYVALTTAKILQCLPRESIWRSKVPGRCIDLSIILKVSGAFNILSDTAILLLPIPALWGLKRSRLRRIGIYAVFTVGSIGPAFSIVGFTQRLQRAASRDQSYNQPIISLWANAELATGVIIICLPVIPGVLQKRRKSTAGSNFVTERSRTNNSNIYGRRGTLDLSASEDPIMNGAFLELESGSRSSDSADNDKMKRPVVYNTVVTGKQATIENERTGQSFEKVRALAEGQILKTVTVTQSDTTI